jgi:hypothetical protein
LQENLIDRFVLQEILKLDLGDPSTREAPIDNGLVSFSLPLKLDGVKSFAGEKLDRLK